ncbi:MAG: formate dehydrogenase accessory sulfurtransferase FdhD, partial [Planctomycetota bacterium]
VTVDLRPGLDFDIHRLERHFYTTSSCGVCGKASLEAIEMRGLPPLPAVPEVDPAVIRRLPQALRSRQEVFEKTGGLHAAGLFRADGDLIYLREDVGRHNALDKLVGKLLLSKELPVVPSILLVSGRASFELVQKALVAGIPALAAVGAPSSLAVELARSRGMTLLGFVNESGFNIYSGGERMGEAID